MAIEAPLPVRALQVFECVGRKGSITEAARELKVTPGAVSQQTKLLEAMVGFPLLVREGRGLSLSSAGRAFHEMISAGFAQLSEAQRFVGRIRADRGLTISGLPSLMGSWLAPHLRDFRAAERGATLRLECTNAEPDQRLLDVSFRLTYGALAERYPHSQRLFADAITPVCAPSFLERFPEAVTATGLRDAPRVDVSWAPVHADPPGWPEWFQRQGLEPRPERIIAAYSMSSLAIEAAVRGEAAALAQESFALANLASGTLVRLSDRALPMPAPYYVCWSGPAIANPLALAFLTWLTELARKTVTL